MDKQKATHFHWIIIALLFFITITNYIDRASISYAIHDITKLFQLSDNEVGLILGGFGVGYFITTLIGGVLVDRYGPRITLFCAVILWSMALLLTGFSIGFMTAFLARTLLGLAEGPNFPAMTRAVGDWLPLRKRSIALSYALMSVPIALAIGGPIVTHLIVHFSWRGMFFILAFIAIVWLPFWWLLFRNFPQHSKWVNKRELRFIHDGEISEHGDEKAEHAKRQRIPGLWRFLLTNKTLLANYWAFFVFGYFLFFFMGWLPTYLSDRFHIQLTTIGTFTVLPWTLAAIFMWITGYVADLVFMKTGNLRLSRSYPIWISQLLAALSIIPILFIHQIDLALIFISLAVAFSMAANASYYAVNIDITHARAGTAFGIMDAAFAISGFVAPALTGWLISLTGHFEIAFALLALLAFSSFLVVFIFHKPNHEETLEQYLVKRSS